MDFFDPVNEYFLDLEGLYNFNGPWLGPQSIHLSLIPWLDFKQKSLQFIVIFFKGYVHDVTNKPGP